MSLPSDNVRLLFTFSKSATPRGPRLAARRSLVSCRLILYSRCQVRLKLLRKVRFLMSICMKPSSSLLNRVPVILFRSCSANLRKIARVCCLMTVRMRRSKPRCCASYTHMIKSPRDAPTKNCMYHWELTGNRNSTFDCELYS